MQPFRLGGGGTIRAPYKRMINTAGTMINTQKPLKGIQPFRLDGGETIRAPYKGSDQHCREMINTQKPLKGMSACDRLFLPAIMGRLISQKGEKNSLW